MKIFDIFMTLILVAAAGGSSYNTAGGGGYQGASGIISSAPTREQQLYRNAIAQHGRQGISQRPNMQEGGQPAFPAQPSPQMFHVVETMPRERILEYLRKILTDLCSLNDNLGTRLFDQPSNKVQSSLNKRKGGFRLANQEASVEAIDDSLSVPQSAAEVVENLIVKLESSTLEIRNLTIIIAMVYLDRIAIELNIYCTTETVLKLFGACLIVASKMHRNETSREALAEALEIPIGALLEVESAITETIQDLAIKPQTLAEYVKPLLAGALGGNRLTAPDGTSATAIQPPPPPHGPPS